MWAVTRSIKFQNKLAKEAIINALKSKSTDMFQDGEMIIRAFTYVTENSIEIFHLFKNKEYVNKTKYCFFITSTASSCNSIINIPK